jgi:hypothetical protein
VLGHLDTFAHIEFMRAYLHKLRVETKGAKRGVADVNIHKLTLSKPCSANKATTDWLLNRFQITEHQLKDLENYMAHVQVDDVLNHPVLHVIARLE